MTQTAATETGKPTPRATVITPWWDHGELLDLWPNNLRNLTDARIIFVDNGSGPNTRDALRAFCDRHGVTLIRNEANRGFAAANNQGAALAQTEYLIFLNNDVKVHLPPVQYLCDRAADGLSGPGPCVQELGEPYLEGWCLTLRRETLAALGGWAEEYTMGYWDDVDLCHRARDGGLSLTPLPELVRMIDHLGGKTGLDGRFDQVALHVKNRAIFVRRHHVRRPKVVVDGVCFQPGVGDAGAARVWRNVLAAWEADGFADGHVVLLDRGGSAPRIPGVRALRIVAYDPDRAPDDNRLLQRVCRDEAADAFASTGYTTPLETPSVLLVHDMIPEVLDWDLRAPAWRDKHHAIRRAAAVVCTSEATRRDLTRFFPQVPPDRVRVALPAAADCFYPRTTAEVEALRTAAKLTKPYFLTVGARGGRRNASLAFRGMARLGDPTAFEVLCAGRAGLEPELANLIPGVRATALELTDDQLAAAYSGAIALLHPVAYAGFGLPVLEAMACGCPVVTTRQGGVAEAAGDVALFVKPDDADAMAAALREVSRTEARDRLVADGRRHAAGFDWRRSAEVIRQAVVDTSAAVPAAGAAP
jgi:GT2 family glycosyltransferase